MKLKKIPYGISNFEQLREGNYIYVDKTKQIEILEVYPPFQFLIRPRRFGKSLFTSVLENYYDINKKDKFDTLFKDLYIGISPTPLRNSYLVLKLSFADMVTNQGKDRLIKSFDDSILSKTATFIDMYVSVFGEERFPERITGAEMAVRYIIERAKKSGQKIFVIIDEYDNFINEIIAQGDKNLYEDLLRGQGYVKTFYKTLKDGISSSIDRIFMTGVSPIMLDDLTSGFNIMSNITMEKNLNEIMGFTEEETRNVIKELELDKDFDIDDLMEDMKNYYNGYLFNKESENRLYNTDMVLYFLNDLNINKKYPDNMLDDNVKTDYRKIQQIAFNFKDEEEIKKIIFGEEISTQIVTRFNLETMYDIKENFTSLLYYLGMLTILRVERAGYILGVPNYVIRKVYWEYFAEILKRTYNIDTKMNVLRKAVGEMAGNGEINPFVDYLNELLGNLSNRDLIKFDEKHLKVVIMTLLDMEQTYAIFSETEVENGYVDLFLVSNRAYQKFINYDWIIELKYLKETERNRLKEVQKEAQGQLEKYRDSKKSKYGFRSAGVKSISMVIIGKKDVEIEAVE